MRSRPVLLVLLSLATLLLPACGFLIGRARLRALPPVPTRPVEVATLHIDGAPVRVIAAQAGTVSVKGCHHHGCLPESLPYPLRFLAILADPRLGARMPVWIYLIVHPEGVIAVDAGATPAYNDPASWSQDPVSGALMRGFLRLDVAPEETLAGRLKTLQIAPSEVRALVLTHQHIDHTGGAPDVPGATIWTTAAEEEAAPKIGAVPWRWRRAGATVRRVDAEGGPRPGLSWSGVALTSDGRVEALHVPGHTPGSVMVRVRADEGEVWFLGDITFRADAMTSGAATSGMHTSPEAVRALHRQLSQRPEPRAFLPAHDEAVPARFEAMRHWRPTPSPR